MPFDLSSLCVKLLKKCSNNSVLFSGFCFDTLEPCGILCKHRSALRKCQPHIISCIENQSPLHLFFTRPARKPDLCSAYAHLFFSPLKEELVNLLCYHLRSYEIGLLPLLKLCNPLLIKFFVLFTLLMAINTESLKHLPHCFEWYHIEMSIFNDLIFKMAGFFFFLVLPWVRLKLKNAWIIRQIGAVAIISASQHGWIEYVFDYMQSCVLKMKCSHLI